MLKECLLGEYIYLQSAWAGQSFELILNEFDQWREISSNQKGNQSNEDDPEVLTQADGRAVMS